MSDRAWRLMIDGAERGAWNMAVDESLLDAVAAGTAGPTLRFYGWSPACLSLGYFQAFEVIDADACRAMGVDVVRRPTGGRAILHDREVTYSITLPAALLGQDKGILPSYHRISRALQAGLAALGVMTAMAPESAAPISGERGAVCFDRPSAHEILLAGRKLVGSAQVRRGGAILQHGSILVEPRIDRLVACLRLPPHRRVDTTNELEASMIGLAELGPDAIGELPQAIARGIEHEFKVELVPGGLGDDERRAANDLMTSKYRSPEWTQRPLAVSAPDTTRTR